MITYDRVIPPLAPPHPKLFQLGFTLLRLLAELLVIKLLLETAVYSLFAAVIAG
jgi:hypothetical protein